jgi:alkylhydroperoxidase family enzyme
MDTKTELNKRLSAKIEIEYPDFSKLPDPVRQKFDSLPTKVNFFRMMGYSPDTFVPVIDLTMAIFKGLTLSDYHKEFFVLMVAAHEGADYEWAQHVSISSAAGVREDQFIAIAENRLDDAKAFKEDERVLLNFGKTLIERGKVPAVVFRHALEHFSVQELADVMIVIGYYRMLSGFIQTFNIPSDPQADGNWVKG